MKLININSDAILNLSLRQLWELELGEAFCTIQAEREKETNEKRSEMGKIVQMGNDHPSNSKRA